MFPFLNKDKTIRFRFDAEERKKRLTWDDLETIEMLQEGELSPRRVKALAARFMTDDKGQYLPYDKALKTLGSLMEEEIQDVLVKFIEAIREAALPKASASGSSSHSVAPSQTPTPSPDGSVT
jgi:hypothetical protein